MAWAYIKEGLSNQPLGPFDDPQIAALVTKGTIKRKTAVQHPTHTAGQWVDAFDAGPLRKLFAKMEEAALEKKRQEDEKRATEKAAEDQRKAEALRIAGEQAAQESLIKSAAERQIEQQEALAGKLPVTAGVLIALTFSVLLLAILAGVPLMFYFLSLAKSAPQEATIAALACALFVAAYCSARSVEKIVRAAVRR